MRKNPAALLALLALAAEMPNPHELEVQRELARIGIENVPQPNRCPKCGGELAAGGGYVGETVLFCQNEKCDQGIVWEDSEDAIRRVL